MATALNIETATPLCSVALTIDGNVAVQRETLEEKSHAARLTVFIREILEEHTSKIAEIDYIAVGKGPGSYTGLRIGVSTAKGLCYGADIPLISVSTLLILYQQVIMHPDPWIQKLLDQPDVLLCPMIDARRMEVFTCVFNKQGIEVESVSARIIDTDSYQELLRDHVMIFFGSGMEKCRETLAHQHAYFIPDIFPHAASLGRLAEDKYNRKEFEDIAYFEPFYLKDFIATIPKKSISV
jgi:tRNA threonylcarbamoyladenosine biosynthesis protein TsaB